MSKLLFLKKNKTKLSFQAYDSVWREALYAKLSKIGFGGKTLSLIKSMYCNDSVRFLLNGHYSDELWLTKGVKQGMNYTRYF